MIACTRGCECRGEGWIWRWVTDGALTHLIEVGCPRLVDRLMAERDPRPGAARAACAVTSIGTTRSTSGGAA